jgi:hypothetical protein
MDVSPSSAVKSALAIYGVYSLLKNVTSNLTLDKLMNMIPGVQGAVDVRICGDEFVSLVVSSHSHVINHNVLVYLTSVSRSS